MNIGLRDLVRLGVSRVVQETVIDRYRLWRARVQGIEVTQSIQYFDAAAHLTDANDRGPDNSVQLVAYKAAWVRVYVRSGLVGTLDGVTATLTLERRNHQMTYDTVATYSPQAPGALNVPATLAYATERGNIGRTLNFVIPAREFHGTLRLTARLTGYEASEFAVDVRAHLVQTLRVRMIAVHYEGPSSANTPAPGQPAITQLNLPAPTLAQLQTTAATAMAAMPVQATGSFAICANMNWFVPLDDMRSTAGGCSSNWDGFLAWLSLLRDNDGNRADVVYYGLLPAGMPLNVPGCGFGGLGSGAVGDPQTFMHEIGHGYGFAHTPCGAAGATDPDYPVYEPYPSASIGEYGLDIRTGTVLDPGTTSDYMSYCFPQWMSLYQHARLLQHPRLAPDWLRERSIFDDYPRVRPFDLEHLWWPDPPWLQERVEYRMSPVISMIGNVLESGEVEMRSVARIDASPQTEGPVTGWHALLLDENGRTLARAPLVRLVSHGGRCGCGGGHAGMDLDAPPFAFRTHLPNVARGASLQVIGPKGQKWVREAPRGGMRFTQEEARVEGDRLQLRWEVKAEDRAKVSVWAQWSQGRGQPWHGLAVELREGRAELPLQGLPAGPVVLRLLAHDGFDTVASDLMPVELPQREPVVAILHPREGQTLRSNHAFQVAGNATETDGQPLPDEAILWLLDGQQVGRGRELWLTGPARGRHELVAQVQWRGGVAESKVRFATEDPGRPDPARYSTEVR